MSTYEPGEQFISEEELKSLLDRWVAPEPSKGLDKRVANSYYTELETADAVARSTPFPLSQKEVVANRPHHLDFSKRFKLGLHKLRISNYD